MKKVLVVAAHPDDEIIGPGGTIAAHVDKGDEVWALILGEGETSRYNNPSDADRKLVKKLHKNTEKAAQILGIKEVIFKDFPDNRFDTVAVLDITKAVEEVIAKVEPSVIYTHHGGDLNIDHRRTFEAVITAARPMEGCSVKEIYAFATLSSTEWSFGCPSGAGIAGVGSVFAPNVFVEITREQLDKKLSAMSCYRSELREFPHPRSLKMIATEAVRYGGISGREYAEGFECVRINK